MGCYTMQREFYEWAVTQTLLVLMSTPMTMPTPTPFMATYAQFSQWRMGCQIWRQYHTHAALIPFLTWIRFVWIFAKPKKKLQAFVRVCVCRWIEDWECARGADDVDSEKMSTKSLVWKMDFIHWIWSGLWCCHVCKVDVIYESIHDRMHTANTITSLLGAFPDGNGCVSSRSNRRDFFFRIFFLIFHSWLYSSVINTKSELPLPLMQL